MTAFQDEIASGLVVAAMSLRNAVLLDQLPKHNAQKQSFPVLKPTLEPI
jgi:hypothetical protein